jgi:hypothetical protein
MSAYQVNKLCHTILHDQEFRAAILADAKSASSRFSLSDEERVALLAGDVHKLYELGASAFLLTILARCKATGRGADVYKKSDQRRSDLD